MNSDFFFRWDEGARSRMVARAEEWTRAQAGRLNTTPCVILAAIRERCWLPEQVEAVTTKYELESLPPLRGVLPIFDAKISKRVRSQEKRKLAA